MPGWSRLHKELPQPALVWQVLGLRLETAALPWTPQGLLCSKDFGAVYKQSLSCREHCSSGAVPSVTQHCPGAAQVGTALPLAQQRCPRAVPGQCEGQTGPGVTPGSGLWSHHQQSDPGEKGNTGQARNPRGFELLQSLSPTSAAI